MQSPRDNLECLLLEYGVKNYGELMAKKLSKEKIIKPSDYIEAPRRVEMTSDQCKKLCDKVGLRYHPGYENRVIERVVTTEAVDRYGDIVRYKGIDNTNYRKNPVVLFAHMHGDFPVGKSIKEWVDHTIKGWRSWDLYFGDEIDTSGRSELTYRMVDSGAMPGGSIGFMPVNMRGDHTQEEKDEMGLGKYGVEYLTCEKLEHSACSVPANPEALSNCLKAIDEKRLRATFSLREVDRMAAAKMLDENLLDVFASVLGVKRTMSTPAPVRKDTPIDTEPVLRPYPNEHACRLADPDGFSEFRRGERDSDGKKYSVIYGKEKDKDTWKEQAYRYPKDTWTESEARSHCTAHDGISFEPATKEESAPAPAHTPAPAPASTPVNVVVNIDMADTQKELCEISQTIKTFNGIIDDLRKSIEETHTHFMAATSRALSALESRVKSSNLYDVKDIENALKIPKR